MSRITDRTLAILLLLGAVGHTLGSIKFYAQEPLTMLWALCASLFVVLLAAVNLLRTNRPADRTLAWITSAGTLCWLIAAIVFGMLLGKPLDPRVVYFVLVCAGLIVFGLRTALREPSRG
jgi:hypothetical protein